MTAQPNVGPMDDVGDSAEAAQFARHVMELHQKLTFTHLATSLHSDPIHVRRRHSYTIVACHHHHVPLRYQIGIMGFRLAQYLRLGWASPQVVYNHRMFWEDLNHPNPNDFHIVALDNTTGSIVGYLGAEFISDEDDTRSIYFPDRPLFPVEKAHHINIADWLPSPNIRLGEIMEIKRFVRNPAIPESMRLLVPLELVLGLMALTTARKTHIPWAVGDLEMHVALRYLEVFGVETQVIKGTQPALPPDDPMWPMYLRRCEVLPFIGRVQPRPGIGHTFEGIDMALDTGNKKTILGKLASTRSEKVEHSAHWGNSDRSRKFF
ncbi:MAG: hypothetical protein Q4C81_02540 [Kocuria sp.]|nr:hypothetical protein [Kocuria sp.]